MAIKSNDYLSYMRLVLGLYILRILQQKPAYGNKLAEEIKRRTQAAYNPNTNALYPLLRIMEDKGYIVGEWENSVTRSKRFYTITEVGIARIPALELMLKERLEQFEWKITILRTDLLGHLDHPEQKV
ncbi:hypothetical protein P22_0789 [Propionispora sp. 2/2-37]|uniref:PadR family transcriptional regulator n=1 Tax=Propionispora sp. 2/2-37 TaxID=1677858 RepID=UPI0006BB93AC|nr:PadR family transcriptional regulator [Propionispora sp. 2/2-37]CUH94723.1 hypothetical protein P22_0789 [Propionispora sp. 2/2-37]